MNFFRKIEKNITNTMPIGFWMGIWILILWSILELALGIIPSIVFEYSIKSKEILAYVELIVKFIIEIITLKIIIKIYSKNKDISEDYYEESRNIIKKPIDKKYFIFIALIVLSYIHIMDGTISHFIDILPAPEFIEEAFEEAYKFPVAFSLSASIIAPIIEEILCRGILFNGLLKKYGSKKAVIFSALLFAIMHLNLQQGISAFFLGIIFALIYLKTGSIYLCIFGHLVNNTVVSIQSFTGVYDFIFRFGIITNSIISIIIGLISGVLAYAIFKKYTDIEENQILGFNNVKLH